MTTWIILFRGINVGGRNVVRMKDLIVSLQAVGLKDVQTYIQSGNVICRSRRRSANSVKKLVATAVQMEFQMTPELLVLNQAEFTEVVSKCSFASDDGKTVHIFFLQNPSNVDCESSLAAAAADTEQWHLTASAFYLFAPEGIGRSRLAATVEKLLQVSATARNLRTVRQLVAMLDQLP